MRGLISYPTVWAPMHCQILPSKHNLNKTTQADFVRKKSIKKPSTEPKHRNGDRWFIRRESNAVNDSEKTGFLFGYLLASSHHACKRLICLFLLLFGNVILASICEKENAGRKL